MNQTNTALELQKATTRILRWRIPLFLALIANIAILARLSFAPAGAVAAQPTTTTAPCTRHSPALEPTSTTPTEQLARSSTTPKTTTSDIAAHTLTVPRVDQQTPRTPDQHASLTVQPSTSIGEPTESTPPGNLSATPAQTVPLNMSDYLPDLSDLADRWWPVLESTAEAAARLAAAQQAQTGGLSISNAAENRVPVSFLLDGRVYTLHPGESHKFPIATSCNIQFHRGGTFGYADKPLSPGEYQFVVGADGWKLQPTR